MDLEHLVETSHGLAEIAYERGEAVFGLRKSEVLDFFGKVDGGVDAERAYAALTLLRELSGSSATLRSHRRETGSLGE